LTFLNTRYRQTRSLASEEIERAATLSTIYGIRGVDFEGDDLVIEYDASRIHEAERAGSGASRRTAGGAPAADPDRRLRPYRRIP